MGYSNESKRMMESQQILRDICHEAIGVYEAKEPKIKDQWRDQSWWQVLQHLKHEIQEIERSGSPDREYHNCLDAIGLCAMLAYKTRAKK